jgi:capsular polysaccharide biosynthesis protein
MEEDMEETISLKEIFQTIKKRVWMIIVITMLFTMISGVISYFFLTPIYKASAQILVNQSTSEQTGLDINQVRTNVEMINSYRVIITSPRILDQVEKELKLEESIEGISVNSEQNSQIFTVSVENADPALAVNIANTIANTFVKEIPGLMNIDNVQVFYPAELPESPSPIKPNPVLNMAIAFVVGLMVGVGIAFLMDYLDNTIKSEQDIEKIMRLPVIGAIGQMSDEDIKTARSRNVSSRLGSETIGS